MDISNCIKFIEFITTEIDKSLKKRFIDDNSIIHLTAELNNLKEKVNNSELPNNIKSSIDNLNTKYSIRKVERNSKAILIFALTFGAWYILYYWRQQATRKKYLIELRHQTNDILYKIKTI